jgi:hypothetical protein
MVSYCMFCCWNSRLVIDSLVFLAKRLSLVAVAEARKSREHVAGSSKL